MEEVKQPAKVQETTEVVVENKSARGLTFWQEMTLVSIPAFAGLAAALVGGILNYAASANELKGDMYRYSQSRKHRKYDD